MDIKKEDLNLDEMDDGNGGFDMLDSDVKIIEFFEKFIMKMASTRKRN